MDTTRSKQNAKVPMITFIIQYVSISTILLLVVFVALGGYCTGIICNWTKPINGIEVYVLAITAGFAGVIGLFIGNRREYSLSIYALFIAALATATAGWLSIGGNVAGRDIVIGLALLTTLSILAEWAGNLIVNLRVIVRFLIVIATIFAFIVAILALDSQSIVERHFSIWILLPFGIAVIIAVICSIYLSYGKIVVWISSGFMKLGKSFKLTGRGGETTRNDDKSTKN